MLPPCSSLLKKRAANIPFWKRCKVKSWGLYRNRLQKPENGAGEAMQPPKIGFSKKKSTILPTKYSAFWWRIPGSNRWPLACHASALPAELIPQMFVPCLTTEIIIPAIPRIVNHFRRIFPRKLKKAKQNPAQNIFPFCAGTFSSSCRCRPGSIFRHWFTCFLLPRTSFHYLIFFTSQRHLQILRYYKGLSLACTPILQKQNPRTERFSILCGGMSALWFPSGRESILYSEQIRQS